MHEGSKSVLEGQGKLYEAMGKPIAGFGRVKERYGSIFEACGRPFEGHGRPFEGCESLKMLESWFLEGFGSLMKIGGKKQNPLNTERVSFYLVIVCFLSGPTEIIVMGTATSFSINMM